MIALLLKVSVILGVALVAIPLLRRAAAATRHAVVLAAQIAALLLPLLALITPPIHVAVVPPGQGTNDDFSIPALLAPQIIPQPMTTRVEWPLVIWLVGASLVIATRLTSFVRACGVVRRARPMEGFALTDEIDHPAAFGSTVLLPRHALRWSRAMRGAVLLHERAHADRRDSVAQLIGELACAMYWFHPFVWLAERRAALERERACDDRVIGSGVPAIEYAEALLSVARTASRRTAMALAAAEHTHLERRIRSLFEGGAHRRASRMTLAALTIFALLATPTIAALTPAMLELVQRPRDGEPDRLGDEYASFENERPPAPDSIPRVDAAGRDAALIAALLAEASRAPRQQTDLVPERARWSLSRVRNGELVEPLLDATRDSDWRIRSCAAWALGMSRDRRATASLVRLLDDRVWRVRAMAASALIRIGDRDALPAMRAKLDDPAWQVRAAVVHYLRDLGDGSLTPLVDAMRSDRHSAVRSAAE